ncbi:MAG: hypothetical protein IPM85_17175 [Chitinophagaceae bacterium]|nr:hypothetical protein [Chitinophagaceae bacterium]
MHNSLAYGRTESVFASLKEAYASAGAHFPDAMILKLQPFNEPLSYYNHDERSISFLWNDEYAEQVLFTGETGVMY